MNIIYVNYRPLRNTKSKDEFTDTNVLTMVLSSIVMQSYGYTTRLTADSYTLHTLENLGITDAWTYLDATLETVIDKTVFDPAGFFNMGKFFALDMESAPCMMMDIDLILWENPASCLEKNEALFTHWESVLPYSKWYCPKNMLKIPVGYTFNPTWDFEKPAANTSIIYVKNQYVKDHYCTEAFRFMRNNKLIPGAINPEVLFVEQQLFPMCLQDFGLLDRTVPVINNEWSPLKGKFLRNEPGFGYWHHYLPESKERVTHTWISKNAIEANQEYRDYYCSRMIEEIRSLSPSLYRIIENNPLFSRYIRLLNQYGSVTIMLSKGIVSSDLYHNDCITNQ